MYLNLKRTLKSGSKEATERSNHRAEDAHRERVQEERIHRDRFACAKLQLESN